MKTPALVALSAATLLMTVSGATAQGFYFGFGGPPGYYEPRPYYGPRYAPQPYYGGGDRRSYGGGGYYQRRGYDALPVGPFRTASANPIAATRRELAPSP